jgi:hypothetical protein
LQLFIILISIQRQFTRRFFFKFTILSIHQANFYVPEYPAMPSASAAAAANMPSEATELSLKSKPKAIDKPRQLTRAETSI